MNIIPESWKDFLFRRKWFSIETLRFTFYDAQADIACNFSATFFMGNKELRRIEIDGDTHISKLMPAQNHPFYHNICVPYLRKTGQFKHDSDAIKTIRALAREQRGAQVEQMQELLSEHAADMPRRQEHKDNVIQFPPNSEPNK